MADYHGKQRRGLLLIPSRLRNPLDRANRGQTVDVVGSPYQTVTGIAEIAPNVNIGRHTHPGYETGYVMEGELTLIVEGKPNLALKPGDSYQIPLNAVHDARSGDTGAKVIAVYIVERGKPLALPAP